MRKKIEYHNDSKSDIYRRWSSMINRCKPGRFSKVYFNRGISVCGEWKVYSNFKDWAINNGFSKELELDRIDNNKGYEPTNCRFVSKLINNSNRSNSVFIDYKGEYISLTLFALKHNYSKNRYNTIRRRIKSGWNVVEAIETPIRSGLYGHKGNIKVINTETGFIFNSIKEASLSIEVKAKTLSDMLNGKRTNWSKLKKYNHYEKDR